MKKIILIAGSNSQYSINKSLLSFTAKSLQRIEVITVDLNDYVLPIYGADFESENGIPKAVKRLDELFNTADGFIISLAEHNGSYAAVFKNTIDWLSRIDMKIWKEQPVLLMATSPGARGGATVLQSAKAYFPFLGANVITDFSLPCFYDNFKNDEIIDNELKEALYDKIELFKTHLIDNKK